MRIFFLTACVCVALGCVSFFTPFDFVSFHKFAFLALACPAAYAGFLFTAVPDWANFSGRLKPHSVTMFAIFALALAASPFWLNLSYFLIGIFWAYLLIFCAVLLALDKNTDNFSVLCVLAAFCALSFAYALSGDERFLRAQIHVNAAAVAVVSFRVSIVTAKEAFKLEAARGENLSGNFTAEDMSQAVFAPNFVYKNLAVTALLILATAVSFGASEEICAFISLGCGFIALARLHEWHYACLLKRHFIAFYYLISLFLGAGYVWAGADALTGGTGSQALHLIAVCGVMGAVMLIFNVAGLRHSGQELCFLRLSRIAFALLFCAGFSRAALANLGWAFYIVVPAAFLALAFVFWAFDFYKIFRDNEFTDDPE